MFTKIRKLYHRLTNPLHNHIMWIDEHGFAVIRDISVRRSQLNNDADWSTELAGKQIRLFDLNTGENGWAVWQSISQPTRDALKRSPLLFCSARINMFQGLEGGLLCKK